MPLHRVEILSLTGAFLFVIDSQENGSGYLFIKLFLAFYIILRAAKAILGNYFETAGIQWYDVPS